MSNSSNIKNCIELALVATWVPGKATDTGWGQIEAGLYPLAYMAIIAGEMELYDDLTFLIDTARIRAGVSAEVIGVENQFIDENCALIEQELIPKTYH